MADNPKYKTGELVAITEHTTSAIATNEEWYSLEWQDIGVVTGVHKGRNRCWYEVYWQKLKWRTKVPGCDLELVKKTSLFKKSLTDGAASDKMPP